MRKDPTPEERLAFRIVGDELGAVVDATREQTAPNQVDGVLKTTDGADFAALEVTIVCDERAVEAHQLLSRHRNRWHFHGLQWSWIVSLPSRVRLDKAKQQLPVALRLLEEAGILRAEPNAGGPRSDEPAMRWFVDNHVEAFGFANVVTDTPGHVREPGTVTVTRPAIGGCTGNMDVIPPWISGELKSSTRLQSKVSKLQQSGFDEQHLFLFVDYSGSPFPVVDVLASELDVPTVAPDLGSITHLWLFPMIPFSGTLLVWMRDEWRRLSIPDRDGGAQAE